MKTIEEQFQKLGVVPVVVLEDKKEKRPGVKSFESKKGSAPGFFFIALLHTDN